MYCANIIYSVFFFCMICVHGNCIHASILVYTVRDALKNNNFLQTLPQGGGGGRFDPEFKRL